MKITKLEKQHNYTKCYAIFLVHSLGICILRVKNTNEYEIENVNSFDSGAEFCQHQDAVYCVVQVSFYEINVKRNEHTDLSK